MLLRVQPRSGFTLVELLVAMGIILFIGALAVAFLPSASTQAREANGASLIQSWLTIAKQRALRDQAPRGVRIWLGSNGQATDCEYLEQPDDLTGGTVSTSSDNATQVDGTSVDFSTVQQGDYIELLGSGFAHQITAVNGNSLTLNTAVPYKIATTSNYRIIRAPRPTGDEKLQLPSGVVIDLNTNVTFNNQGGNLSTLPANSFDILFGPTGSMIAPSISGTFFPIWVRFPDAANPTDVFAGDPTILAVSTASGFAAAYSPVNGTSPYSLVQQ